MHLLSQQTSKFNKRRCYGWQNSRWDKIARKTNGELLSAWYLCTYLRAHFYRCGHGCGVNSVCAHSVLVRTCITATRVVWQQWFSKAERLVDHFQMVGHLKCSIKRRVSNLQFGGQKGVRANSHQPSLPTGPAREMASHRLYSCSYVIVKNNTTYEHIPLQFNPFPSSWYPVSQLQMKLPMVLLQLCWQPPFAMLHSLMSIIYTAE